MCEQQKNILPALAKNKTNKQTKQNKRNPEVGTPYNGLYGEGPLERSTFFRLQVCKRVGISQVEVHVYKRAEK